MNALTIGSHVSLTMSSREIADLTGKRHDHVMRDVRVMLVELHGEEGLPNFGASYFNDQNKEQPCFCLPKRESLILISGYSVQMRAKIIDRWQELEQQTAPALPQNLSEALRLAADLHDQKERAEAALSVAVATKAEIGSRREATAMQTASVAAKKAHRLEIELDQSKDYATVKRMERLYHGQPFNWRALKSAASDMGIPPIDVFDQNYGTVKAYHADVWREVYALEIEAVIA